MAKKSEDEINIEIQKRLHEGGQFIGELFSQEINSLVNKHKEFTLSNDSQVIALTKLAMMEKGFHVLADIHTSFVHPKLWPEFYMVMSRVSELMYTEGERIRKEVESENK